MQIVQFVQENDLDAHIARLIQAYRSRRDAAISAIKNTFPKIRIILVLKVVYSFG